MPIYYLSNDLTFPPIEGAVDGIVAVGGDLSTERLLLAYQEGIFPWSNNEFKSASQQFIWPPCYK